MRKLLWKQGDFLSGIRVWRSYLAPWEPIVFSVSELKEKRYIGVHSADHSILLEKQLRRVLPLDKWYQYRKNLQSDFIVNNNQYRTLTALKTLLSDRFQQGNILGFPIKTTHESFWILFQFEVCDLKKIRKEIPWLQSCVKSLSNWLVAIKMRQHQKALLEVEKLTKDVNSQETLQHFIVHQMKTPIFMAQNILQKVQEQVNSPFAQQLNIRNVVEGRKTLQSVEKSINMYLNIVRKKSMLKVCEISLDDVWKQIRKVYANVQGMESNSDSKIHGNLAECFMIFESLIENAKKATQNKGWIKIEEEENTQYCIVWVRDSGPGVLPENVEKVFEPFYSTHTGGHGLGLFYCAEVIQKMGGDIHYIWDTCVNKRGFRIRFQKK